MSPPGVRSRPSLGAYRRNPTSVTEGSPLGVEGYDRHMGILILVLVVLAIVALIIGWRTHENIGKVLAGFGLLLLLGYAFSWIGALIGLSVRTPEAATSGGLIWLFPLTFISNAFVDANNMPGFLQHVAEWNPFSATVQAARELFGNLPPGFEASSAWPMQHPVWASLIWSIVIIVVFRTLAVRKYRRVES